MPPLRIDARSGLLEGVRYVASPFQDERPPGAGVELVVVHGISLPPGQFGEPWIDRLFTGALDPGAHPYFATISGLEVSAHLLVRRDGEITQYVPFHRRAWHAGESSWRGRTACNDFSVGIELEGADTVPYEAVQYERLAELIRALATTYPGLASDSLIDRIASHSEISPGRKTDPGPAFDWPRLHALLAG